MSLLTNKKLNRKLTFLEKIEFCRTRSKKNFKVTGDEPSFILHYAEKIYKDYFYKTPMGYADWSCVAYYLAPNVKIMEVLKEHQDESKPLFNHFKKRVNENLEAFIQADLAARWTYGDNPVYCISQNLLEGFSQTNVENIVNIFCEIEINIPSCIILFPVNTFFYSEPDVFIDFAVIGNCLPKKGLIQIGLNLSNNEQVCIRVGQESIKEKKQKIAKNIRTYGGVFFQIVLAIAGYGDLISDVTQEDIAFLSGEGFGKPHNKQHQARNQQNPVRYPRWLGKNYKRKTETTPKGGTHSSPRTHWRRGHLRIQPCGEGRQEKKIVWIEPVLVNAE